MTTFKNDPQFAAEFLNGVLADGDEKELLIAMRQLTLAFGGVADVAKLAELHPKTLYKTLSKDGNPELPTLTQLFKVMGLRLAIAPIKRPSTKRLQVA